MKPINNENERGVFTVIVALIIPVLLGIFGLSLDLARYTWVDNQLQNAADAAAFAGGRELNGTSSGRTNATAIAAIYAQQNSADGRYIAAEEVVENTTGNWNPSTGTFTAQGVSDAAANAIRVTVWRQEVQTFFARAFADTMASKTLAATAIAVAGGAGGGECTAPFVLASCVVEHDADGEMVCPTSLSFQNGLSSTGLTLPDGDSPVTGKKAESYIQEVMSNPGDCSYSTSIGDTLYLQNGNDLSKKSTDDINAATNDGADPVSLVVAVVDLDCGNSGPNYNQSTEITGYVQLDIVGARGTGAAPVAVEAACPGIGKKNICVSGGCSPIANVPAGGTAQVDPLDSHLVQ